MQGRFDGRLRLIIKMLVGLGITSSECLHRPVPSVTTFFWSLLGHYYISHAGVVGVWGVDWLMDRKSVLCRCKLIDVEALVQILPADCFSPYIKMPFNCQCNIEALFSSFRFSSSI